MEWKHNFPIKTVSQVKNTFKFYVPLHTALCVAVSCYYYYWKKSHTMATDRHILITIDIARKAKHYKKNACVMCVDFAHKTHRYVIERTAHSQRDDDIQRRPIVFQTRYRNMNFPFNQGLVHLYFSPWIQIRNQSLLSHNKSDLFACE